LEAWTTADTSELGSIRPVARSSLASWWR
jgi:hypothetical protein